MFFNAHDLFGNKRALSICFCRFSAGKGSNGSPSSQQSSLGAMYKGQNANFVSKGRTKLTVRKWAKFAALALTFSAKYLLFFCLGAMLLLIFSSLKFSLKSVGNMKETARIESRINRPEKVGSEHSGRILATSYNLTPPKHARLHASRCVVILQECFPIGLHGRLAVFFANSPPI